MHSVTFLCCFSFFPFFDCFLDLLRDANDEKTQSSLAAGARSPSTLLEEHSPLLLELLRLRLDDREEPDEEEEEDDEEDEDDEDELEEDDEEDLLRLRLRFFLSLSAKTDSCIHHAPVKYEIIKCSLLSNYN